MRTIVHGGKSYRLVSGPARKPFVRLTLDELRAIIESPSDCIGDCDRCTNQDQPLWTDPRRNPLDPAKHFCRNCWRRITNGGTHQ